MELLFFITGIVVLPLSILGGVLKMRMTLQRKYDREQRKIYRLQFPADVPVDRAVAEIRSLPASIKRSNGFNATVPSMVFETISRGGTFEFRVRVPKINAEFIVSQLRAALPGIAIEPLTHEEAQLGGFNGGLEVGMTHPDRVIEMGGKPADIAVSLLNSFSPVGDEAVVMQWVIAATGALKLPAGDAQPVTSTSFSISKALLGRNQATRDELNSRRSKVEQEPNFYASLRIAASSESRERSLALAHNVVMSIKANDGPQVSFRYREIKRDLSQSLEEAWTPVQPQLQLSVSELVPRIGWPLGSDFIDGVRRNAFRHLMPSPEVPTEGIIIGVSTMPGRERPIAMPTDGFRTHTYIGGKTEVGKTTLGVNMLRQMIATGAGAIIMERDGDLIRRTLDQVQPHDLDRVIHIDFTDPHNFVGINPLDFESPSMVATKLADLFEKIYDIKSLNLRKLLYHGLPALVETGDATLLDFLPLIDPKNDAERAWAKDRLSKLKTKELVDFFNDWNKKSDSSREKAMEPVLNRFWELTLDPQISRMLNSTHSTIDLGEALRENRIVCVNLKGVDTNLAQLVGSLLVSWIWDLSANNVPERADNVLFIDEAHLFSHLEDEVAEMLSTGRKRGFGVVVATQFVNQLPKKVQSELSTNARTKLIFESGKEESDAHVGDFASREVDKFMLMNLTKFTAVAKVKLPGGGVSQPLTLRTVDEPKPIGYGHQAVALSNSRYARSAEEIDAEQRARRRVKTNPKTAAPTEDEPAIRPFDAED